MAELNHTPIRDQLCRVVVEEERWGPAPDYHPLGGKAHHVAISLILTVCLKPMPCEDHGGDPKIGRPT